MNYLQMYINIAYILICASIICWAAVWVVHEGNNSRRTKIASLIIATLSTLATIFCAAMAGLLS